MVQKRVSREIETKRTETRRYALSEGFGLAYKIETEISREERFDDDNRGVRIFRRDVLETVIVARNEKTYGALTPREYFRASRTKTHGGGDVPLRVEPVRVHVNMGLPDAVLKDLKTLPAVWELAMLAKPQRYSAD